MTPNEIAELLWLIYDYETEEFDRRHCLNWIRAEDDVAVVSPEHQGRSRRNAISWRKRLDEVSELYGVRSQWRNHNPYRLSKHYQVKERLAHLSTEEKEIYNEVMRVCTLSITNRRPHHERNPFE